MLNLYNSLTRRLDAFEPADGTTARIYSCGPTVYDYPHIGNLRAFVIGDTLCRWLRYIGYETRQVMNLTDVDDKTIAGARGAGVALRDYTRTYEDAFFEDLDAINVERAWKYPRATEHIGDMQDLVSKLMAGGHAYEVDGDVYFDVSSFPEYGNLSGVQLDQAGPDSKFGRLAGDEYEREEAADFVLWKAQKEPEEPAWDSPWGPGRPGWHIECSAMSMKYLGPTLDIHNGGVDLLFPHHENEVAQSQAATGQPFVRFWLHSAHLLVDGLKMSKSLGNFYTLRDLLELGHEPMAIRHQLQTGHYRKPLNFTLEGLEQSRAAIDRLHTFVDRLRKLPVPGGETQEVRAITEEATARFQAAMNDDLNVPGALGTVFEMLREINLLIDRGQLGERDKDVVFGALKDFDRVLGIMEPAFETEPDDGDSEIDALVAERDEARRNKQFDRADEIRDQLSERGVILEDTPDGTMWRQSH